MMEFHIRKILVDKILFNRNKNPSKKQASAFANTNIALVKYWGKRNESLILPFTSSLSYTLKGYGTHTSISCIPSIDETITDEIITQAPSNKKNEKIAFYTSTFSEEVNRENDIYNTKLPDLRNNFKWKQYSNTDFISLNGESLPLDCDFSRRILEFLSLFRDKNTFFKIETHNNFPTSAGLASSASGAAALVMAIDKIYDWNLTKKELSILARLISGSGCRSVYDCYIPSIDEVNRENGVYDTKLPNFRNSFKWKQNKPFVLWNKGTSNTGIDSFATQLDYKWPNLCFKIIIAGDAETKKTSSRKAMKDAFSSPYYANWESIVKRDIKTVIEAIKTKDFNVFGQTIEKNALYMHKIIETTNNPIVFFSKETLTVIEAVKKLRNYIPIYFTIDAGPNVVVFFLKEHKDVVDEWTREL